MNHFELQHLLKQLDNDIWQALFDGQPLALVDDERLVPAAKPEDKIFILPQNADDVASLRESVIKNAEELLNNYYLSHPLSKSGFTLQVKKLVEQYGASAFAAVYPDIPERTLFVDVGEVVAEDRDSARHRYGAYCELQETMQGEELKQFVQQWLTGGDAYELYIGMNVCRYGCDLS